MNLDNITIVYCLNKIYELYAINSIQSLLDNNFEHVYYNIYVIHDGSINEERFINHLKLNDDIIINFKLFERKYDFYCDSYIQKPAYYRLFLTELLPTYIDKCIYIDCDTYITNSLTMLNDININKFSYGAIKYSKPKHADHLFNDGVLLVNLKKLRKNDMIDEYINYMDEHRYLVQHDETVINMVHTDIKVIPNMFNYFNIPPNANQQWLNNIKNDVYIIHDLSKNKLLLNNMIHDKYIKNTRQTKYPQSYYTRALTTEIKFNMATSSPKNYYGFSDTYNTNSPLEIKFYDWNGYGNYYIQFVSYHWDNSNYSKYHHKCINLIPLNYYNMHPDELEYYNSIKDDLYEYVNSKLECHYCNTNYTSNLVICEDDCHDYEKLACKTCGQFKNKPKCDTHTYSKIKRCFTCGIWKWFTQLTDEQKKWDEYKGCLDDSNHIIKSYCCDSEKCVYIRELCFYCSKIPRINGKYNNECTTGHRYESTYCIHCGLNRYNKPCENHNYDHIYNDKLICKYCNKYEGYNSCQNHKFKADHCVKCGLRKKRCNDAEYNDKCKYKDCIYTSDRCLMCGYIWNTECTNHMYEERCINCYGTKFGLDQKHMCKYVNGKCNICDISELYDYRCTTHEFKNMCKICGLFEQTDKCTSNKCKWCGIKTGKIRCEIIEPNNTDCDICGKNNEFTCTDCVYELNNCTVCNKLKGFDKCEQNKICPDCNKDLTTSCYNHEFECSKNCEIDCKKKQCLDCNWDETKICGECDICGYNGKTTCEINNCLNCNLIKNKQLCSNTNNCKNCNLKYGYQKCLRNNCKICGLYASKKKCNEICSICKQYKFNCTAPEQCVICGLYSNKEQCLECTRNNTTRCQNCGVYYSYYPYEHKHDFKPHEIYKQETYNCKQCGINYGYVSDETHEHKYGKCSYYCDSCQIEVSEKICPTCDKKLGNCTICNWDGNECTVHDYSGCNFNNNICINCGYNKQTCDEHDYSGHNYKNEICIECGFNKSECYMHIYRKCGKVFEACVECKVNVTYCNVCKRTECLTKLCNDCKNKRSEKCINCNMYIYVPNSCVVHRFNKHNFVDNVCTKCNINKYIICNNHEFRNCVNCNQKYNSKNCIHEFQNGRCINCYKIKDINCDKCVYTYCLKCGIDYNKLDCKHNILFGNCKYCNILTDLTLPCVNCGHVNVDKNLQCPNCGLKRVDCTKHNLYEHSYSKCKKCNIDYNKLNCNHKYLSCNFVDGICTKCKIKHEQYYYDHDCIYDKSNDLLDRCVRCNKFKNIEICNKCEYRNHNYNKITCIKCNKIKDIICNNHKLNNDYCVICGTTNINCEHEYKSYNINPYECSKCGKNKNSYGKCEIHQYNTCNYDRINCYNCGRYKNADKSCEHENSTWNCVKCNIKQNYQPCVMGCVYHTNYCMFCGLIKDKEPCYDCNYKSKICLNCGHNSITNCDKWQFKHCNCENCWRFHKNYNTTDNVHDEEKGFDECATGYNVNGKDTMVCLICSYPSHNKFNNRCTHENNWFGKCIGCLKPTKLKCGDCDYGFEKTTYCISCGQRNKQYCNFCNYIKPCDNNYHIFKGGECVKCNSGKICSCNKTTKCIQHETYNCAKCVNYCNIHQCMNDKNKCYICTYDENGICTKCGNKQKHDCCSTYKYTESKCEHCNVICTHRDNLIYNNTCLICGKTVYKSMGNLEEQYIKQTKEIKSLLEQVNALFGFLTSELTEQQTRNNTNNIGNSENVVDAFKQTIADLNNRLVYGENINKYRRSTQTTVECSEDPNLYDILTTLSGNSSDLSTTLANLDLIADKIKTIKELSTNIDVNTSKYWTTSDKIIELFGEEKGNMILSQLTNEYKRYSLHSENKIPVDFELIYAIMSVENQSTDESNKHFDNEFIKTRQFIEQLKSHNKVQLNATGCNQIKKILKGDML
jgi:lipopolysaccharide biosynthesis glycosyltransferase